MFDYSNMLIYLNSIGIRNTQIAKIENIIKEENLETKDILEKKYISLFEDKISKSSFEKLNNLEKNNELYKNLYERTCKNKINVITYKDCNYPQRLKYIENFPRVIYFRGDITTKDNLSISIVGSRKHTNYGSVVVRYIVDELSKLNVTIISGMAYGIDSLAHKRSLDNNNRTIAVLGNGVDVVYPIKNSNLYMNIIEKGAVLSEYPLGTKSMPYHFPERNRIISGLSLGTIVIEAKDKSGSLITAKCAAEQGREIFAVPGNINSVYSEGTNMLIRDGAIPFLSIDDLLYSIESIKDNFKKEQSEEIMNNLTDDEKIIYNLILSGTNDINNICINSKFDISYTNSLLTILELKELIESNNNKDFYIKNI